MDGILFHRGLGFNNVDFNVAGSVLKQVEFEIVEADLGLTVDEDAMLEGFDVVHLKETQVDIELAYSQFPNGMPITNEIADDLDINEAQVSYRMEDLSKEELALLRRKEGRQFWMAPRNPEAMAREQERLHERNVLMCIKLAPSITSLKRIARDLHVSPKCPAYAERMKHLEQRERQAQIAREVYAERKKAEEAEEQRKLAIKVMSTRVLIQVGTTKKVVTKGEMQKWYPNAVVVKEM